eukprot:CAMPEP_0172530332 /NCGR_PEP_ID=MMETSP1067-20121228/4097_1 /TAXON_ID=265564 ORGANISM="Thalassiosira punctigera, Strain Tpunct2005C2" /NCGR_SAMPLE_ID=MMETSP1067 /ASSEMBLY_ACC=CAM_ASM_000444 /LENGTH=504 /DNA_ID=CAMNT_0013314517 /DNA_START=150 /DNA_END=1664 /DNA_ORIENTATION=-
MARFGQLLRYKEEHGDCNVPQGFPENPQLSAWVNHQRRIKKKNQLSDDRVSSLERIGFCWEVNKWNEQYERLKKYRAQRGNCNVPQGFPENPQLGSWVHVQRTNKKKGKLSDERIERLERIGFCWGVTTKTSWENRYKELKKYMAEHGHCNVPQKYTVIPGLGQWVKNQRIRYRLGKLSDEQIERLKKSGFIWNSIKPRLSHVMSEEKDSDAEEDSRGFAEETEAPKDDSALEGSGQVVAEEGATRKSKRTKKKIFYGEMHEDSDAVEQTNQEDAAGDTKPHGEDGVSGGEVQVVAKRNRMTMKSSRPKQIMFDGEGGSTEEGDAERDARRTQQKKRGSNLQIVKEARKKAKQSADENDSSGERSKDSDIDKANAAHSQQMDVLKSSHKQKLSSVREQHNKKRANSAEVLEASTKENAPTNYKMSHWELAAPVSDKNGVEDNAQTNMQSNAIYGQSDSSINDALTQADVGAAEPQNSTPGAEEKALQLEVKNFLLEEVALALED